MSHCSIPAVLPKTFSLYSCFLWRLYTLDQLVGLSRSTFRGLMTMTNVQPGIKRPPLADSTLMQCLCHMPHSFAGNREPVTANRWLVMNNDSDFRLTCVFQRTIWSLLVLKRLRAADCPFVHCPLLYYRLLLKKLRKDITELEMCFSFRLYCHYYYYCLWEESVQKPCSFCFNAPTSFTRWQEDESLMKRL